MQEYFVQCPHCWESIAVVPDPSVDEQVVIEDCSVCCNPLEIRTVFMDYTLISLEVSSLEQ